MELKEIFDELDALDLTGLYERDWMDLAGKSDQELAGVFAVADALRELREKNYATAIFRTGLALWEGPAEPGYAAFAAACAMLGLQSLRLEELDGQTLVSAAPDVICPRRDLGELCDQLYRQGAVTQRPLSLPRDTALPMVLSMLHDSGGVRELRGGEIPFLPDMPQDLPDLAQRFDLKSGTRELGGEERWRMEALRMYVLGAMILLAKCPKPVEALKTVHRQGTARRTV